MNSKIIRIVLGLFLLVGGIGAGITLIGQNQDIRSHASCMSRCTAEADECEAICGRQDGADSMADYGSTSDQQSGSRTSDSAPGENFPASYNGDKNCAGKCTTNQTCVQFNTSGYYYCKVKPVISYTPPPVIIPTPRGTPIPITIDVAINSYNFTPNTVGYDCSKGGCGAGSGPVSGFYETNPGSGIYRAIGGTGNVPYYEEEVNRAIQVAQDQQERDELAYEQYRLEQLAEAQAEQIRKANEERVAEIQKEQELEQARKDNADLIADSMQDSSRASGVTTIQNNSNPFSTTVDNNSNPFANSNQTPVYDFTSTPTKTDTNPFLTTSSYTGSNDFISWISDKFNNAVSNSSLDGFGETGLGGGNATLIPPSTRIVDTVNNNGGIYDYALGNAVSFGAGFTTAALVTPGAPAFIFETATSIPGVIRALTLADVTDNIITGVGCAMGNPDACAGFQASILIPAPTGVGNMLTDSFEDLGRAWTPGTSIGFFDFNPIRGLSGDLGALPKSATDFVDSPGIFDELYDLAKTPLNGGIFSGQAPEINPDSLVGTTSTTPNVVDDLADAMNNTHSINESVIDTMSLRNTDNDLDIALNQLSDSPRVDIDIPSYEAPPRRTFSQWADDTILQPIADRFGLDIRTEPVPFVSQELTARYPFEYPTSTGRRVIVDTNVDPWLKQTVETINANDSNSVTGPTEYFRRTTQQLLETLPTSPTPDQFLARQQLYKTAQTNNTRFTIGEVIQCMGGNVVCLESVDILHIAGLEKGIDSWEVTGKKLRAKEPTHTWLEFTDENGIVMVADPLNFGAEIIPRDEALGYYKQWGFNVDTEATPRYWSYASSSQTTPKLETQISDATLELRPNQAIATEPNQNILALGWNRYVVRPANAVAEAGTRVWDDWIVSPARKVGDIINPKVDPDIVTIKQGDTVKLANDQITRIPIDGEITPDGRKIVIDVYVSIDEGPRVKLGPEGLKISRKDVKTVDVYITPDARKNVAVGRIIPADIPPSQPSRIAQVGEQIKILWTEKFVNPVADYFDPPRPNADYFERYGVIKLPENATPEDVVRLQKEFEHKQKLKVALDNSRIDDAPRNNKLIEKTKGPVVEIGGPTLSGFKTIDIESLEKPITVTNINKGVLKDGRGYVGIADYKLDANHIDYPENSVGAYISRAQNKAVYDGLLRETYRTLEPNGILVMEDIILNDIDGIDIEAYGFKAISQEITDDGFLSIILQKPKPTIFDNVLSNAKSLFGPGAYFKTGAGFNTPTMIIGGIAAGYILEKTNIDEFIIDLFTSDSNSDTPISKFGKSINERVRKAIESVVPPPVPADTNDVTEEVPIVIQDEKTDLEKKLENFTNFMQIIINPDGTISDNGYGLGNGATLTELGCAPASAINALTLLEITEIDWETVIDEFYWDPKDPKSTGADAVLMTLQQSDDSLKGAAKYGTENRILDATELTDYTGILIYGGWATGYKGGDTSLNEEIKNHVATITCEMGDCYSIDSYFSDGKPVKCEALSADKIDCGSFEYKVGEAPNQYPSVLLPVINH